MKTGMLWFDNSSRSIKEKVTEAAAYYLEKYGQAPTLCFVNPATLEGKTDQSNGVEVREAPIVMPHHFWIGVDTKPNAKSNGH